MIDCAALQERAEPREVPPGPDIFLSWVCALWLINAATGATVAIREDLPGELIAGVFVGKDASAEFFNGPGTALSPGLAHIAAQAVFAVLSTRGGTAAGAGSAAAGARRGAGGWAGRRWRWGSGWGAASSPCWRCARARAVTPSRGDR